ncbi:extracellular solute-binding protein, family 5 [Bernardetia litoralis DSM 6794]|uniref:Extracellular solute-binding protein, family 5 n=1 Tax=Bernardetia litoralis (strain ATCC 23117 / DSM 6794 / NBRC 15988 / NCIMB 1366 / Fx l1 / Sio-4) TaxID=880071 RepID=I4AF40_BERLS|nr:ABC transporter substrate-binding protein [Bernardetia litoralis]AFM02575.1 extracellular solute-binding protein, family 5 [Bernardetia litoralis DSM 6794]
MKFLFYISIFILFIISLFSCNSEEETQQINQKIFRYNELEFVKTLNPLAITNEAERRIVHQIFNGLWRLENDGNFYPSLADSTKQIDSLTWEFVLKPTIQLHSTSTQEFLTSKDVIESLTNWAKKESKTDKKLSTQTKIFKEIIGTDYEKAFEIIDEKKFIIHLKIPFSPLIQLLSCTESLIVPNKKNRLGDKFSPVGSGAFYVDYFEDNQKITLKKNQNYFHKTIKLDTLPLLDEIHVYFYQNSEHTAHKILNNELDWIPSSLQSYTVLPFIIQKEKELSQKKYNDNSDKSENQSKRFVSKFIQIDSFPILKTAGFEIQISDTSDVDLRANFFTIQSFRQALNMGIYRESFKQNVSFYAPAHEGIFPNILPKHTQNKANGYYYHPQTSKGILQKVGFDSTNFIKIFAEKKDTVWVNIARKQWKSIGINSILYLDKINKSKADLIATTFESNFADESFLFWKYFDVKSYNEFLIEKEGFLEFEKAKINNQSDSIRINKNDLFALKQLDFDSLFIEYLTQKNEIEREFLSNQLKNNLIRSSPFIEIFYLQTHQIRRSYIAELVPNTLGIYHFDRLDKSILESVELIREDYMYEEKSVNSEQ